MERGGLSEGDLPTGLQSAKIETAQLRDLDSSISDPVVPDRF
jgi:hypothetical protein